jgi:hypothetical protein
VIDGNLGFRCSGWAATTFVPLHSTWYGDNAAQYFPRSDQWLHSNVCLKIANIAFLANQMIALIILHEGAFFVSRDTLQ